MHATRLLAIRSLVSFLKLVDPVLLPSPLATFRTLWEGMQSGKLGVDFARTVVRTITSTAIAAVIAIPLGILLGSSEKVYGSASACSRPSSSLTCPRCVLQSSPRARWAIP